LGFFRRGSWRRGPGRWPVRPPLRSGSGPGIVHIRGDERGFVGATRGGSEGARAGGPRRSGGDTGATPAPRGRLCAGHGCGAGLGTCGGGWGVVRRREFCHELWCEGGGVGGRTDRARGRLGGTAGVGWWGVREGLWKVRLEDPGQICSRGSFAVLGVFVFPCVRTPHRDPHNRRRVSGLETTPSSLLPNPATFKNGTTPLARVRPAHAGPTVGHRRCRLIRATPDRGIG